MRPSFDLKDWFAGVPNQLTLARILAIPLLLLIYPWNVGFLRFLGALIFLIAALTDFFDGFLARKYQMESNVGALLDPIADKMLIVTGLILLVSVQHLYSTIAVILIGRELAVQGLRLLAMERNLKIEVNQFGKLKTGFQVAAIFCLMLNRDIFDIPFRAIGMLCIWVAVGLSLYSAYTYFDEFVKRLKNA